MANLDDDEKWLAHKYFPMLIAESESSPEEDALEHVVEVATIFTNTAMRRVLYICTLAVRAGLLMIILRCLPTEVYSDFAPMQAVTTRQGAGKIYRLTSLLSFSVVKDALVGFSRVSRLNPNSGCENS